MTFEHGYALLIGIGTYSFLPKANIPISVNDAQQVRDVLCSDRYCGYRPEKVTFLHDQEAGREGILEALRNLAQKASPADTVFLYYSGHGEYDTGGNFCMSTHDTRVTGSKITPGTGISEQELLAALRAIPAGKLIFFFNACHAGEIAPHLGLGDEVGSFGAINLPNATVDAILASGSGRMIVTACREQQQSWVGKGDISIFARALVDGLKGRARYNAGYIGAFGLYEYLFEAVKEAAGDLGQEQEPELTVLKGVGPFPVALYRGVSEPQSFDVQENLPEEAAVRRVSERASQRELARITSVHTGGGAYIAGNVNTGGGDFAGRDLHKMTVEGDVNAPVIVGSGNVINNAPDLQKLAEQEREKARRGYLAELRAACQVLPLAAIGGDESGDAEITLDQVYIDMDTTTPKEPVKAGGQLSEREQKPISALEAASATPRLVLLGDPGAGKSTFVRRLVGWSAEAGLGEAKLPDGLNADLTPILITLRDLAQRLRIADLDTLPASEKQARLLSALHDQIRAELKQLGKNALGYADALLDTLSNGRCLLVLDGLDEVPFDLRERVRETVAAALRYYHVERVIITCRVRSYSGPAVFNGFEAYSLAPFDGKKIEQFTRAWYNTQLALRKITGKEQAEKRAADLTSAGLALRELASNPMLLTSMAMIHQRDIGLPEQRVRLYSLVVDVLARRWQKHKAGELAPSERLAAFLKDDLRLRGALTWLGYEAHRAGGAGQSETGDLQRMEALHILEGREYLGEIGLANEFLDYVDQRAGLLVGRGGEPGSPSAYGFPHRSLQEYLAGCHLIGQRDLLRTLYALAAEGDTWDLAVQLGMEESYYNRYGQNVLLDLAYAISQSCQGQDAQQERMLLWSGQAAALLGAETIRQDAGRPDGGPRYLEQSRGQLIGVLGGTLAPFERSEAGKALAALGDPRFNPGLFYLPVEPLLGFVEIPAGPFWMGSDPKEDPWADKEEQPYHAVNVSAFYIARYPVTVAQFRAFVERSGYQPRNPGSLTGIANHPVALVSWDDAQAYCGWLNKALRAQPGVPDALRSLLQDGCQIRLPTEAEWEKAARGTDGRLYPWGNDFDPNKANTWETHLGTTSPVGCFLDGASPYGIQDISGNVLDWCADWYGEKYYSTSVEWDPKGPEIGGHKVVRGGSWGGDALDARCTARVRFMLAANGRFIPHSNFIIGFRCVLSR